MFSEAQNTKNKLYEIEFLHSTVHATKLVQEDMYPI